jgi:thiamine biosynthesis lipoprotein
MIAPRQRTILLLMLAACLSCAGAPESAAEKRHVAFRTKTMGTWAALTLVTADSAAVAGLAYQSLVVLHRVDSLMSNWTDRSDVARINREAPAGATAVHPEVSRVLGFAQAVYAESGGAFDITVEPLVRAWGFLGGSPRVPSQSEIDDVLVHVGQDKLRFDAEAGSVAFTDARLRIDLGGIAKGYGIDEVAAKLREFGVTDALADLSGNMVAIGNAATHPGWTVGVRDPAGRVPYLARLHLFDQAIATSGDYEQFVDSDGVRYGHILDPRTGWSARGLSSVSVVSANAMTADAWATALFVLGPEAARQIAAQREDLDVVLVEPVEDGPDIIWVEASLADRFEPVEGVSAIVNIRTF